ncbi:hypothetical protein TeGR_g719 [Tetraparma gracilis]|uniref:Uncharacterized protein n=1 Tax=Tetraparma gracilis TaxID=2962635 RepID=A0ABQ6MPN8_9STRA|nr:hypothetical protein TeGR_g719 [Tetraparma gracilis]
MTVPPTRTVEDTCSEGRVKATSVWHSANEVIVVDSLKLVYVLTRKTGCTTMMQSLNLKFGARLDSCKRFNTECAFGYEEERYWMSKTRCSSKCITDDSEINGYFWFGVARDPLARFYSAVQQAKNAAFNLDLPEGSQGCANSKKNSDMIPCPGATLQDAEEALDKITSGDCDFDQHLESQAAALSTAMSNGEARVPLDYILRTEHLADDFAAMIQHIGDVTRSKRIDKKIGDTIELLRSKSRESAHQVDYRTDELDARVRDVYKQDFACFDYADEDNNLQ